MAPALSCPSGRAEGGARRYGQRGDGTLAVSAARRVAIRSQWQANSVPAGDCRYHRERQPGIDTKKEGDGATAENGPGPRLPRKTRWKMPKSGVL